MQENLEYMNNKEKSYDDDLTPLERFIYINEDGEENYELSRMQIERLMLQHCRCTDSFELRKRYQKASVYSIPDVFINALTRDISGSTNPHSLYADCPFAFVLNNTQINNLIRYKDYESTLLAQEGAIISFGFLNKLTDPDVLELILENIGIESVEFLRTLNTQNIVFIKQIQTVGSTSNAWLNNYRWEKILLDFTTTFLTRCKADAIYLYTGHKIASIWSKSNSNLKLRYDVTGKRCGYKNSKNNGFLYYSRDGYGDILFDQSAENHIDHTTS